MNKNFYTTVLVMLFTATSFAQTSSKRIPAIVAEGLNATIEQHNLLIKWSSNNASEANYWEVQGSIDGKTYTTIGMVMGQDPKATKTIDFRFKQPMAKIKPGLKYYRVLHMETPETGVASNIIQLTK